MPVTTDKILRLPDYGAFQNGIVIRVSSDHFQLTRNRNDFGESANLVANFCCLAGIKAAFEAKLFNEFSEDLFASNGEAFASASYLNTAMRIPPPANG